MLKSVNNLSDFGKVNDSAWTGEEVKEKITWTPFHEAASSDCHEILEYFIRNDVPVDLTLDLDCPDPGFTALHYAAQRNNLQSARILIKKGASICSMIEGICDPIHLAVFYGHVEMVTLLLDHGADVNLRFNNNFFIENKDYLGDVDFLGGKMHESLWQDHNITLLHCSILRKFDNLTQLLLDRGADVDLKTSLEKTTLMQAIEVNNDKLAEYLVKERNANVEDRDIFGKPAIFFLMLNANRLISKYSKAEFEQEQAKYKILAIFVYQNPNMEVNFPEDGEYTNIIHYMIRYGFSRQVESLLYFSSINVEKDFDFNVTELCKINPEYITPDIKNDFNYLQVLRTSFYRTARILFEFACSKRFIGYPYDERLIKTYAKRELMTEELFSRVQKIAQDKMIRAINVMKETPIGDGKTNVMNLLEYSKYRMMKVACDKRLNLRSFLKNFIVTNMCTKYYYFILLTRIVQADYARQYFKKCTELLCIWFKNQLPMDCCEKIVSYFDFKSIDPSVLDSLPYDEEI